MKKFVNRLVRRIVPILLAVCLTVCCLPVNAFAWKNLTHVNSANLILLEILRSNGGQVTIKAPYGSGTAYTHIPCLRSIRTQ